MPTVIRSTHLPTLIPLTNLYNHQVNLYKHCPLVDPLPTELVKTNVDILGPIFTTIINRSLASGSVPQAYKEAVVSPIIKKSTQEPTFSNFRPVSNLPFLSKIVEKVVCDQINAFTDSHSLDDLTNLYNQHSRKVTQPRLRLSKCKTISFYVSMSNKWC